jgi:hypothetical protein
VEQSAEVKSEEEADRQIEAKQEEVNQELVGAQTEPQPEGHQETPELVSSSQDQPMQDVEEA